MLCTTSTDCRMRSIQTFNCSVFPSPLCDESRDFRLTFPCQYCYQIASPDCDQAVDCLPGQFDADARCRATERCLGRSIFSKGAGCRSAARRSMPISCATARFSGGSVAKRCSDVASSSFSCSLVRLILSVAPGSRARQIEHSTIIIIYSKFEQLRPKSVRSIAPLSTSFSSDCTIIPTPMGHENANLGFAKPIGRNRFSQFCHLFRRLIESLSQKARSQSAGGPMATKHGFHLCT
jgi:hypothetical protein